MLLCLCRLSVCSPLSCLYYYGPEEFKLWFRITIAVHRDDLLQLTTKEAGKRCMKSQSWWLLVDTERPAVNVFKRDTFTGRLQLFWDCGVEGIMDCWWTARNLVLAGTTSAHVIPPLPPYSSLSEHLPHCCRRHIPPAGITPAVMSCLVSSHPNRFSKSH